MVGEASRLISVALLLQHPGDQPAEARDERSGTGHAPPGDSFTSPGNPVDSSDDSPDAGYAGDDSAQSLDTDSADRSARVD